MGLKNRAKTEKINCEVRLCPITAEESNEPVRNGERKRTIPEDFRRWPNTADGINEQAVDSLQEFRQETPIRSFYNQCRRRFEHESY